MLPRKTEANWSDVFVPQATENMSFGHQICSPVCMEHQTTYYYFLSPKGIGNHEHSCLHLSLLSVPPAVPCEPALTARRFHKRFSNCLGKLDTLGFSSLGPAPPLPPSPPTSLLMEHTTPRIFLVVCAFPFHDC